MIQSTSGGAVLMKGKVHNIVRTKCVFKMHAALSQARHLLKKSLKSLGLPLEI